MAYYLCFVSLMQKSHLPKGMATSQTMNILQVGTLRSPYFKHQDWKLEGLGAVAVHLQY